MFVLKEIELPIGGKGKGKGAKAVATAAARSALRNINSGDKSAGQTPVPRQTPPRSATAPAYTSPTKVAQLTPSLVAAAAKTAPAAAIQAKLGSTASVKIEEVKPEIKAELKADIKPVALNLPPAMPLSQPKVFFIY